jgi:hypothetical protein
VGRASASINLANLLKGMKVNIKALARKEGETQGLGLSPDGKIYLVNSGNKAIDDELWKLANKRLAEVGPRKGGATSGAAADVEQKFAAIMFRDKINKADVVINNSRGPCRQTMGCDQLLNRLLGTKELTAHWPDAAGAWRSHPYENRNAGMGGV